MHASACIADQRGQSVLQRGVRVLVFERDGPFAGVELLEQGRQPVDDRAAILIAQVPLFVQHLRVGDAGAHVVANEPGIQVVIFTCRVAQDTLVQRFAFVPKPAHGCSCLKLPCP